jgi:putative spermidine/putrescine transport system ATP-binding protein
MAGDALSVVEVEVAFGRARVLDRLCLEVAAGEFVALLGSSGCGKTTLLRAISGFAPVRSGRILIGDRDVTHAPPERRGMAMVFQSYALWPHMTTAQNIAYGLRLRGAGRAERARRVEEVLALLGLGGFGQRPVTQLSGGQRQRVALGRALAVNPGILLLDEPLSNLDARVRQSVRHEIKALQSQLGITAIHVTHDREEAMVMADRIAIMDAGTIVQEGPPEEIYNRPASPFVAAFMGADNVIELSVRQGAHSVQVAAGAHNDAAILPLDAGSGEAGVHVEGDLEDRTIAHFRSEAARLLTAGDAPPAASLILQGAIRQISYPGGFYRYAVTVGARQFMVDDPRRIPPATPAAISLPAAALHLYPAERGRSGIGPATVAALGAPCGQSPPPAGERGR